MRVPHLYKNQVFDLLIELYDQVTLCLDGGVKIDSPEWDHLCDVVEALDEYLGDLPEDHDIPTGREL